jgi:hypothetical protein
LIAKITRLERGLEEAWKRLGRGLQEACKKLE